MGYEDSEVLMRTLIKNNLDLGLGEYVKRSLIDMGVVVICMVGIVAQKELTGRSDLSLIWVLPAVLAVSGEVVNSLAFFETRQLESGGIYRGEVRMKLALEDFGERLVSEDGLSGIERLGLRVGVGLAEDLSSEYGVDLGDFLGRWSSLVSEGDLLGIDDQEG